MQIPKAEVEAMLDRLQEDTDRRIDMIKKEAAKPATAKCAYGGCSTQQLTPFHSHVRFNLLQANYLRLSYPANDTRADRFAY